jgi:pimeloyl-ACP methyl ester carboxylesterase
MASVLPRQQAGVATERPTRTRQTYAFERDYGPLVVDVWTASAPSGATPVLLVHGWGGTGSYWRSTAFALSETVDVIVPDLPGTGRSQPVSIARRMHDQVDALRDVLDSLDYERVQVIGHSMGGAMALLLADAEPERVESIVLTSVSFFMTPEQEQVYRKVMQVYRVTMQLRPDWLASMPLLPRMLAHQYFYRVPDNPRLLRQGLQDYLQIDAATAVACADDATDPAIPEAGARVGVPVLLVACRQDRVMPPENVDYTAEIIPQCEVRWIEECGHMPMIEKADEYMGILHGFMTL